MNSGVRRSGKLRPLPAVLSRSNAARVFVREPSNGSIVARPRIDGDGNATSKSPGDVTGTAQGGPVEPGATGVMIVLDTPI